MTAVDTHIAPHIPLPVLDSAQGAPSAGTTVTKVDSPVDSNPPKPATPAPTATPVATPQQHKPATANMAPVKPGKIHPRNHPNPTMTFPDRVEGFVDLETLTKIHSALCESQDPEDRQLASWVKEQYLWEPIENSAAGRPIQTREGFGKLETAYRRVRHLTNRAQDKWPFFDRNWKSMNAAMVRKVAMGELGMASPAPQAARGYQAVSRQNGFVAYHGTFSSRGDSLLSVVNLKTRSAQTHLIHQFPLSLLRLVYLIIWSLMDISRSRAIDHDTEQCCPAADAHRH